MYVQPTSILKVMSPVVQIFPWVTNSRFLKRSAVIKEYLYIATLDVGHKLFTQCLECSFWKMLSVSTVPECQTGR